MPDTNLRRRKGATPASSSISVFFTQTPLTKSCALLLFWVVLVSWTVLNASFFRSSTLQSHDTDTVLRQNDSLETPQSRSIRRASPYENRTQKILPKWARKPFSVPEEAKPEVCFVHIGKTAGSTLACLLGFAYSCGDQSVLNGDLPQKTTHLNHNTINDCPETTEFYLVTTRDPLERIKSWFAYERPSSLKDPYWAEKRPLFVDCPYATLNELAEKGLSPHDTNVSHECKYRAWEAIRGKKAYCRHNFYNYQYYINTVPTHARILAIRSEHIANDWNAAEKIVSSAEIPVIINEEVFKPRNKTRKKSIADTELSNEAQKFICRALCKEIRAYKEILARAENLDSTDFEKSMELLDSSCPEQSRADRCLSFAKG